MQISKRTKFGKIVLDDNIILSIVCESIAEMRDVAILSDSKGYPKKIDIGSDVTRKNVGDSVEVFYDEDKDRISLKLFVVYKFGESINDTSQVISDMLRKNINAKLNMNVGEITIAITGVVAKKFKKRDIEFKTYS